MPLFKLMYCDTDPISATFYIYPVRSPIAVPASALADYTLQSGLDLSLGYGGSVGGQSIRFSPYPAL